jgi:hypothetical protein
MDAPDDPLGTVRAGPGVLAIRAHSANPDHADEISWFVVDIGIGDMPDNVEALIATWPIAYQPPTQAKATP